MGRFKIPTKQSKTSPENPSDSKTAFPSPADRSRLTSPIDFRALCYFRASFVVGHSRSFKYLETFYQDGDMSDYLSLSIQSVGIASLLRDTHSRELEPLARRVYATALNSLNTALRSPALVKKDNTLSSVLLLEHFERLLPSKERTVQAWTNHLQGASALLKIRGAEQFMSKTGFDLFAHFSSYIMLNCMKHGIPVPEDFLKQRRNAAEFFDTTDPTFRFLEFTIRFIRFRAELTGGVLNTPEAIIASAQELDNELSSQLSDLPPSWIPKTIRLESKAKSRLIYESHYHVYTDYRMAECVNLIRMSRVILSDLMMSCEEMQKTSPSNPDEDNFRPGKLPSTRGEMKAQAQPRTTFREMTGDICACVPQLAGYLPTLSSQTPHILPRKLPPSNIPAAYVLLWPLCALAHSKNCPAETRMWITDQLIIIARAYDLEKGWDAVRFLEKDEGEREKINIWNIFEDFGTVTFTFSPDDDDDAAGRTHEIDHERNLRGG